MENMAVTRRKMNWGRNSSWISRWIVICARQALSDNLDDTLNYIAIYEAAKSIVEGEPAKLLEHIAEKIASAALEHEMVQSVTVRIRKPHIALPVALEFLGIEITGERQ